MFDFPDIPKTIYNKNFLRSTAFVIEFSEIIKWQNHQKEIASGLTSIFPSRTNKLSIGVNIAPKVEDISFHTNDNSFVLKAEDGRKQIDFDQNMLSISFLGDSYVSFSSLQEVFEPIKLLLDTELAKYSILRFSERKINLIDFNIQQTNGVLLLKQLINSQLIGNIDYTPNTSYIKQAISSITFEKQNANLNIKYGYNKVNDIIGQIILDLTITFEKDNNIASISNFEVINSELYRAFNWAITDEYKKLMNHE